MFFHLSYKILLFLFVFILLYFHFFYFVVFSFILIPQFYFILTMLLEIFIYSFIHLFIFFIYLFTQDTVCYCSFNYQMGTHLLIEPLFTSHLRHHIIITCLLIVFVFNYAIQIFATATADDLLYPLLSLLLSFSSFFFSFFTFLPFTFLSFSLLFIPVGDNYHESFVSANQTFFECVIPHLKQDDVVWVHDYHLMLLPKLLREAELKISIVFYLHIPFPTSQIFRALPSANELLQVRT